MKAPDPQYCSYVADAPANFAINNMNASAALIFIFCSIIAAPFGRHVAQNQNDKQNNGKSTYRWWFGPMFDARMSWFLFESPNLIWLRYCFWYWCDPNIFFLDSYSETSPQRNAISFALYKPINYISTSN